MCTISSQDALILLRSFSAPEVLQLLRCLLSVSHPALLVFDSVLNAGVQRITIAVYVSHSELSC